MTTKLGKSTRNGGDKERSMIRQMVKENESPLNREIFFFLNSSTLTACDPVRTSFPDDYD